MAISNTRFVKHISLAAFFVSVSASSPAASRDIENGRLRVATDVSTVPASSSDTPAPPLPRDMTRWSDSNIVAFREALADRAAHGLDRVDFFDESVSLTSSPARDAALTKSALRYAAALASGIVNPAGLHPVYTIPRPMPDLAAGLKAALAHGTVREWFSRLAPQDREYRELSKAYLAFRQEAQATSTAALASSDVVRPGDHDGRMVVIAQRLVAGEYLANSAPGTSLPTDSTLYSPPIVAAVKSLQRDYGVADDGVIGEKTLAILNLRPGDRARALAVAMERRRWLSHTPPATRIDVNVAAARLYYYRDGMLVDERRVIAGEPGKETPPLLAPIYRLVANPTWTIPKSIQNGEMAHVGKAYLKRHNMVLRNGWIVQKSGPSNALGVVKFDMKDDQAIYLHDTSNRSLFARSQRHLSHGCVRVENAPEFAQRLADDEGIGDRWRKAQASGQHRFVALPEEIPVRLLYHNVFVDQQGDLAFRTDPYDWNPAVASALGFGDGEHMKAKADPIDVGP